MYSGTPRGRTRSGVGGRQSYRKSVTVKKKTQHTTNNKLKKCAPCIAPSAGTTHVHLDASVIGEWKHYYKNKCGALSKPAPRIVQGTVRRT